MEDLHWIRRLYRSRLARYQWARLLKRIYLYCFFSSLRIKHVIVWRFLHSTHTSNLYVTQNIHQLSLSTWFLAKLSRLSLGQKIKFYSMRSFNENQRTSDVTCHNPALAREVDIAPLDQKIRFHSMHSFNEIQRTSDVKCHKLVPAREVDVATPVVYPEKYDGFLYSGNWNLAIPAIEVFEISDTQVMGKSDLLFLERECLHHDLYNFERDFLFEEMHEFVSINLRTRELARLIGAPVGTIPAGISLLGSTTSNYIHWLTETMPKLALLDELESYNDIPLIIDAELHPNILESISIINSRGRDLITLGRGEILKVTQLIGVSPVAYIPFDFKPGLKLDKLNITPDFAMYSPDALTLVRSKYTDLLGKSDEVPRKRLFLRRTGDSRRMTNAAEVEELVSGLGFHIVEPEKLGFAEQVSLFSNAELIVAQGGAALGNMVFAPVGCHVIVLSTWSPYTIYYYFSNIASLLGQRCSFILCEPVQDSNGHRAHMGLNVPVKTLKRVIST